MNRSATQSGAMERMDTAMPGIASLESPLVQQSRSEIKSLAAEIAALAHGATQPEEFYRGFLNRVLAAIGAVGGGIWQCVGSSHSLPANASGSNSLNNVADLYSELPDDAVRSSDTLILICEQQLPTLLLTHDRSPSESHASILTAVLAESQPMLIPPGTVRLDVDRPSNPIDHSLIIVPVVVQEDVEFLIEIVQRPSGGPATQRGYLRFVAQMADLFADYQRQTRLRELSQRQKLSDEMGQALVEVSKCRSSRESQQTLTQWLRILSSADHALLLASDGHPKVLAIADTGTFDRRSELIVAIEQMAQHWQVANQKTRVAGWQRFDAFDQTTIEDAESVEPWKADPRTREACLTVAHQLNCASLVWLPLGVDQRWIGLLAFPDPLPVSAQVFLSDLRQSNRFAEALGELLTVPAARWRGILAGSFMQPGQSSSTQLRRRLVIRSLAVVAAMGVACLPVPQRVAAVAELHPLVSQHYFAPMQGLVDEVLVQDGQQVAIGQALLKIENIELNASILRLESHISSLRESIAGLSEQLAKLDPSAQFEGRDSRASLAMELDRQRIDLRETEHELALRVEQRNRLTLRAQTHGRVSIDPANEQLRGRIVSINHHLLSVIDPHANWRFDVAIPEWRLGLVEEGSTSSQPRVRIALHGFPEHVVEGTIDRIEDRTTSSSNPAQPAQSERVVMAQVHFSSDQLPVLKDGALAKATIDCGRTPLGWLIVRDAYRTIESSVRLMW